LKKNIYDRGAPGRATAFRRRCGTADPLGRCLPMLLRACARGRFSPRDRARLRNRSSSWARIALSRADRQVRFLVVRASNTSLEVRAINARREPRRSRPIARIDRDLANPDAILWLLPAGKRDDTLVMRATIISVGGWSSYKCVEASPDGSGPRLTHKLHLRCIITHKSHVIYPLYALRHFVSNLRANNAFTTETISDHKRVFSPLI